MALTTEVKSKPGHGERSLLHIRVAHKNGLHMRVVAKAIHFLSQYIDEDSLHKVYIEVPNRRVPFFNLLQVTALNIGYGETVGLAFDGPQQELLKPLGEYLSQEKIEDMDVDLLDQLVEQMVIAHVGKLLDELDAVKAIKDQYDLLLRTVNDAICLLDGQGVVQYVNPAFAKLYGVSAIDIIGHNANNWSHSRLWERVYTTQQPLRGEVIDWKNSLVILLDMIPVTYGGSLYAVVCISRSLSQVEGLLNQVRTVEQERQALQDELIRHQRLHLPFMDLVGQSRVLVESVSIANKAAKTRSTVLITGESGTGKELLAKAIHNASGQGDAPFVRVNCAGIPVNLIESELFGHERGAFTGAVARRKGKFELAQNGTIFLDEIGELPIEVQAKLLRVLQERELERVGGDSTIPLNVRVIAATNRDLEAEVKQRKFREDLYYRINVVRIHIPPLRDRTGDVSLLVNHFIQSLKPLVNQNINGCTREVLTALEAYHWPGNVRELRNVIERAMNLCDGAWITVDELPQYISSPTNAQRRPLPADLHQSIIPEGEPVVSMEEYEKRIIARALKTYGSYNAAAKALGLTHKTVARKARQYGLVKMPKPIGHNS